MSVSAHFHPAPRPDAPPTPAQRHAALRATPRTPAATARLSPWLNRDFGGPAPGGQLYTPEQDADRRAAADAEKMAAALSEYAKAMRLAAKWPDSRRGFQAEARAALHMHAGLAALIGGDR